MTEDKRSIERAQQIIEDMVLGYGDKFVGLEKLRTMKPSDEEMAGLEAYLAAAGRYKKSTSFLSDVISGKAVGLTRFNVATRYFLALDRFLTDYQGRNDHQKIVSGLNSYDRAAIRVLATTVVDVYRAEQLEAVAEHDTAAAMDYLKLLIAERLPHLAGFIEAMHFAITSEDNMGNVFGLIGNRMVYGYLLEAIADYCLDLIAFSRGHAKERPLYLPAFTHVQGAEPITEDIITANTVNSVLDLLSILADGDKVIFPFSGKLGGATGTLICHYAAYPDGDWLNFGREFVEGLGLHYTHRANQCVTYAREAQIFTTLANIINQLYKNNRDFIWLASCPAQFFVKKKKEGAKGSSVMPGKSNAWGGEGGYDMEAEIIDALFSLARRLPQYPHQGDMARSYPMRNLGTTFAPIFTALKRSMRERKDYVPNQSKIDAFFHEYPGLCGSALQTVLKRMNIPGDAYRKIQAISINHDGSYANQAQFRGRLAQTMEELDLNQEARMELLELLEPAHLLNQAQAQAVKDLEHYSLRLGQYKALAQKMQASTY